MKVKLAKLFFRSPGCAGGEAAAGNSCGQVGVPERLKRWSRRMRAVAWALILCLAAVVTGRAPAQSAIAAPLPTEESQGREVPPRVRQAERFLAAHGWASQRGKNELVAPYSDPLATPLAGYRTSPTAGAESIESAPATARLRAARASARLESGAAQSRILRPARIRCPPAARRRACRAARTPPAVQDGAGQSRLW